MKAMDWDKAVLDGLPAEVVCVQKMDADFYLNYFIFIINIVFN